MTQGLSGKTVAILVANGFEELEMTEPQRALLAAGATLKLVSPEQGLVNGWHGRAWGHYFPVDIGLSTALAADFDALLVPGGARGVEKLGTSAHTKRFLKGFIDGGKPVALIGHAPVLLAGAERAKGRTVTAAPDVLDELTEAGAKISEEPVVTDANLLTTQPEADLAAVKDAVVKLFTEIAAMAAAA